MPWSSETKSAFEEVKKALGSNATTQEREQAIRLAIQNGIPLYQIEDLLDWLEMVTQMETTDPAPNILPDPG